MPDENLKVGAYVWREAAEIFVVVPTTFLALQVQLVVLVNAFRDGQYRPTVWSVIVCCSYTHGVPRAQPFVKVEGAHALCPMASATCTALTEVLFNVIKTR